MGTDTKIEWADHTFNPWLGCTPVSAACDHCYAEAWAKRSGLVKWGSHPRRRTSGAAWATMRRVYRDAKRRGVRERVFCASLADVFDNQVPDEWRMDLFAFILETADAFDWLLLTKRLQNIIRLIEAIAVIAEACDGMSAVWTMARNWVNGQAPPNVWLGTTVENQEEADRRIPQLLAAPAVLRFLSCEPLLGPVDISEWLFPVIACRDCPCPDPLADTSRIDECCRDPNIDDPLVDWVICGGESGPGARPMHPVWARGLRDQCIAAGVAFFFKQWGEWRPHHPAEPTDAEGFAGEAPHAHPMRRVGKKAAGRLLDGREWNEFPKGA